MTLIASIVKSFFDALSMLLLARAVMSWVVQDWSHPLPQFVYQLTEPILMPMRTLFYRLGLMNMGIDLSFLATWLLLNQVGRMLYIALYRMA